MLRSCERVSLCLLAISDPTLTLRARSSLSSSLKRRRLRMFLLRLVIIRCASQAPSRKAHRRLSKQMMALVSSSPKMCAKMVCCQLMASNKSKRRSHMEVKRLRIARFLSSSSCLSKKCRISSSEVSLRRWLLLRPQRMTSRKKNSKLQRERKLMMKMSSISAKPRWSSSSSVRDRS